MTELPYNETDRLDIIRKSVREIVNSVLDEHLTQIIFESVMKEVEDVDEISTTSATPGYLIPGAFQGTGSEGKERIKKTAIAATGWQHTDQGLDDVDRGADKLHEAKTKYHEFKLDQERTATQKIGDKIREVKISLREISKGLKMVKRYKNEVGYSSEQYWDKTRRDIYKMERMIMQISKHLREIRS